MDEDVQKLEQAIQEAARKYTDEHLANPTAQDYVLIQIAFTRGWQMGVQNAIAYMREHGTNFD